MRYVEPLNRYFNHLLDASRHVSILVVAHLSIYRNCYDNKTVSFISYVFLGFRQNFSFPTNFSFFAKTFHFLRIFCFSPKHIIPCAFLVFPQNFSFLIPHCCIKIVSLCVLYLLLQNEPMNLGTPCT